MSGPFGSSPWGYNPGGDFYSYTIDQSLRFNDNDSAYLSRTPASAGSLTTWTWSGWVKRGNLAAGMPARGTIFGSSLTLLGFFNPTSGVAADNFGVYVTDGEDDRFMTNRVFRDTSAWYHFVVVLDTTNSTADDRFRLYVNGVRETSFSRADTITQNRTAGINATAAHAIGRQSPAASQYFDGYLAEINFIDGTALTADSFGEFKDGIWIPKNTSGLTFGTNGFYLPFDDSAAIGDDESSNTNDWTVNNLVATDVVPDSPTNNFPTFNLLKKYWNPSYPPTISEGNLRTYTASNYWATTLGTMGVSSGKWYAEFIVTTGASAAVAAVGILDIGANNAVDSSNFIGYETNSVSYYGSNGTKYITSTASAYGNTWGLGDIIGVALDLDAGTVKFYKNNTVQNSGTAAASSLSGTFVFGAAVYATTAIVANFGQDSSFAGAGTKQNNADDNGIGDFYYAPPSGHLAVCSANLPTPTIVDGSENFNTVLWTGDAAQTRSLSGLGFEPDFSWLKIRSGTTQDHQLYDVVRGAGSGKSLSSNTSAVEGTVNGFSDGDYGYLSSFDADGFSVDDGAVATTGGYVNYSGRTYVAWNWKAGGTAVSNTDGSITSQVSANTDAGFSIATFTKGSGVETVGHGLSVAPDLLIVKRRNGTGSWFVYHSANTANPETDYLRLNSTNATADNDTVWGDTAPTTSVFSVGAAFNSSETLVCYAFHSVESYSKVGSYVGNGNADGTFVYTGHRPSFLLIKRTDANGTNWWIFDNKRSTFNVVNDGIITNGADAEFADNSSLLIDFSSNGFKVRNTYGDLNTSGANHIFLSFAENPFKYANAR